MTNTTQIDIRPRNAGEILDDAWQMYFDHAALLLALVSLFTMPAFAALLWLLTQPAPRDGWHQLLLAACVAALLPLSGLSSGACQEVFRRQAEGRQPTLACCIGTTLSRFLSHATARALVITSVFLGIWLLVMPGLAAWVSSACVHSVLAAGEPSVFGALRKAGQVVQRQPGKSAAVVLCRLALLVLAVLNLHLFGQIGLWIAEHLAGMDIAFISIFFTLGNSVYLTGLVLLSWLLLAPFAEAANYLLHSDGRARYEGLDLWYRVQRFLVAGERSRAGLLFLTLGGALIAAGPVRGQSVRSDLIKGARQEIKAIVEEVAKIEPFPGGKHWTGRLRRVVQRLDGGAEASRSRFRWFHQAIDGFDHRNRQDALEVLKDVDQRLATIEQSYRASGTEADLSRERLRQLLPSEHDEVGTREQKKTPPRRVEARKTNRRPESQVEPPQPVAYSGPDPVKLKQGFEVSTWLFLAGCAAAVIVLALLLFRRQRSPQPTSSKPATGPATPSLESILTQPDQFTVAGLWKQADQLAQAGNFREAVRMLYLAVLALLHRANRIRFERTRTNGEYVGQTRSQPAVYVPFNRLTGLFEVKWYSEVPTAEADYGACRDIAEDIRAGVQAER